MSEGKQCRVKICRKEPFHILRIKMTPIMSLKEKHLHILSWSVSLFSNKPRRTPERGRDWERDRGMEKERGRRRREGEREGEDRG